MVKVKLNRSEFSCARKSCGSSRHPIDRHHVRHEKLFIRQFLKNPLRSRGTRYKKLCARYERFNKKDIRLLCRTCHSEIHEEYRFLAHDASYEFNRYLADFTWKQADILMSRFESYFKKWINEKQSKEAS